MGLYDALGVGASGLAAQRMRVEALAENIANSETTRTPGGGPYRRKQVVFESMPAGGAFGTAMSQARSRFDGEALEGVRVSRVEFEGTEPERRFEPDHPDADEQGYVLYPGFNPVEDMVDMTASVRSYQANLAVIDAIRQMINATIDVAR
jgi:flagellar basal-body rod protein FlgC